MQHMLSIISIETVRLFQAGIPVDEAQVSHAIVQVCTPPNAALCVDCVTDIFRYMHGVHTADMIRVLSAYADSTMLTPISSALSDVHEADSHIMCGVDPIRTPRMV